jgi:hypothetical protein
MPAYQDSGFAYQSALFAYQDGAAVVQRGGGTSKRRRIWPHDDEEILAVLKAFVRVVQRRKPP